MTTKRIIILILLGLIAIAAVYVAMFGSGQSSMNDQSVQGTDDKGAANNSVEPANQETSSKGSYVAYTPSVIAETTGSKLLFFHAEWCPQCRALEQDIKTTGVPQGTTIIKVNYDTSHDLRKKYNVRQQTTIVKVDDNGNALGSFVAYDQPTVAAVVQALGQ